MELRLLENIFFPLKTLIFLQFRLIHITDWLPTLVSMANGSSPDDNIDGVNQWPHFSQNESGIRSEILYGIGEKDKIGYRHNDMKLMVQASFCQTGNIKGEAKCTQLF